MIDNDNKSLIGPKVTELLSPLGIPLPTLETIRATVARKLDNAQFALFMHQAHAMGLNPLTKEIVPVIFVNKDESVTMSIQPTFEGIKKKAKQATGYKGMEIQIVHENDDFEAERVFDPNDIDDDGRWRIVKHVIHFPRGKIVGGYGIARREGFRSLVIYMDFDEVRHLHDTYPTSTMWKKWTSDMFRKHIGLRIANLQYDLDIAEGYDSEPERVDVTPPEKDFINVKQLHENLSEAIEKDRSQNVTGQSRDMSQDENIIEVGEGKTVTVDEAVQKHWDHIQELMDQADLTKEWLSDYIMDRFRRDASALKPAEVSALDTFVDMEVKKIIKNRKLREAEQKLERKVEQQPNDDIPNFG